MFYTAPTAIRSLIRRPMTDADFRAWQIRFVVAAPLGSVGEPINPGSLDVVLQEHRRRASDRRYVLANRDWRSHDHAAAGRYAAGARLCTQALPGIAAAIVDETANDVPNGSAASWSSRSRGPSMIRTIWGDPERFKKSVLPG